MLDKSKKLLRENRGFILFFVLMVAFRSAVADWNSVPSGSMLPTIVEGDRIFVNKLAYDVRVPLTHISLWTLDHPDRGEIIVFDSKAADKRLVKRVIGVPGDVVEMTEGRLIVNGQPAVYSHVRRDEQAVWATESLSGSMHSVRYEPLRGTMRSFGPVVVPSEHYLVLGDNRDNSMDSRYYGFVPRREIVGRSTSVVMSFDPERYYLPRRERFFDPLQ